MSSIATVPVPAAQTSFRLSAFNRLYAPLVASWVRSDAELFWLAPGTLPPLTAAKVATWPARGDCPMLLWTGGHDLPVGYAELNRMPHHPRELWIGHFVVADGFRGLGYGRRFIELLLDEAFQRRGCRRVSLSVFPENFQAIRCYMGASFRKLGEQVKRFEVTGQVHRMLKMGIDARRDDMYLGERADATAAHATRV